MLQAFHQCRWSQSEKYLSEPVQPRCQGRSRRAVHGPAGAALGRSVGRLPTQGGFPRCPVEPAEPVEDGPGGPYGRIIEWLAPSGRLAGSAGPLLRTPPSPFALHRVPRRGWTGRPAPSGLSYPAGGPSTGRATLEARLDWPADPARTLRVLAWCEARGRTEGGRTQTLTPLRALGQNRRSGAGRSTGCSRGL